MRGVARGKGRAVDALLFLMALIWGTNFSIVKSAFQELPPQAFNALRMIVASAAILVVMALARRQARRAGTDPPGTLASVFYTPSPLTRHDVVALVWLGLAGHALYQFFFIGGLARTSVANSSLMLAATPVVIALISVVAGQERISPWHWLGTAISGFGIYLVVGQGLSASSDLTGDLMMFGAVCCWAAYTLGARPLMERHSPVAVTGLSMVLGTVVYVPLVWPRVREVQWEAVSGWTFGLLVYSAIFALCVAYTIWYVGVRQIGSARTSGYSNLVPIVAMASAAVMLGEPVGIRKLLGAAAVLAGVALTRTGRAAGPARHDCPAEE